MIWLQIRLARLIVLLFTKMRWFFMQSIIITKKISLDKSIVSSCFYLFIYLLNTIQYAGLFKCGREQQRSHVPRGRGAEEEEEEEAVKVEVYNQGMFKTELCNKWQEKGTCPYGDLCQFAHGITELRPIIRHPRYKTEVCRMVLAGATCPYGHRCHFRHSLCPPWLTLPWCQKLEGWVSWNVNNSKQ